MGHVFKDSRVQISSTRKKTPEGYLIVDALIARTGIQEYQGYELPSDTAGSSIDPDKTYRIYRSEKEVFSPKFLDSLAQKPVTNEHPHDVGGLVNADTATKKLVGVSSSDVGRQGDKIKVPLVIYDASTINDVEQGKVGISAGYTGDIVLRPGITPDGKKYDGIVINMRGNHIAICDADSARGGKECRILDEKTRGIMKTGAMNDPNTMGGADGVPDLSDINQIGQMLQSLTTAIKEGFQTVLSAVKGDSGDDETVDPAEDEGVTDEDDSSNDEKQSSTPDKKNDKTPVKMADSSKLNAMQKQIDFLQGQLVASKKTAITDTQINRVVSERVKLVKEAEQILPGQNLLIMDSTKIKQLVIESVMPGVLLDAKTSPAFIDGAYQTCVASFLNGGNSAFGLANAIKDSYGFGGDNGGGEFADVDSGKMADDAQAAFYAKQREAFHGSKK